MSLLGYHVPWVSVSTITPQLPPVDALLDLQSGQAIGTVTLSCPLNVLLTTSICILVFQKPLALGYGQGIFLGSAEWVTRRVSLLAWQKTELTVSPWRPQGQPGQVRSPRAR